MKVINEFVADIFDRLGSSAPPPWTPADAGLTTGSGRGDQARDVQQEAYGLDEGCPDFGASPSPWRAFEARDLRGRASPSSPFQLRPGRLELMLRRFSPPDESHHQVLKVTDRNRLFSSVDSLANGLPEAASFCL